MQRVLVANRGEIALRIIRACRELNIETIAIYSEADRDSLHVKYADRAVCVGPAPSAQSYLNLQNIISAAVVHGADAIHPGYGYLSEQPLFAEMCEAHKIVFVGPSPEQIELMGDKSRAKAAMAEAGLPVIPGSDGPVDSDAELISIADDLGYPVIIKAAAGGGGRGMRLVWKPEDLLQQSKIARAEAQAAFGNDQIYLEKYFVNPRHIEVQVLADQYGSVVHLGERECSLQRRHQKLLEECPSPAVHDELRVQLGAAAVNGAKAVGYRNVGTMEFLLDADGKFYFMEMNTRIQVEHPVTEMVYGIDLVKEQLRIAAGEPLGYDQAGVAAYGHAIECRITAEAIGKTSRPSPGTITRLYVPGGYGIRWDSHVYQGYTIPPYYDSMFGKLIAWGTDREEALRRMERALDELVIEGIETSIPFHRQILQDRRFRQGEFSTRFVDELLSEQI
ncbi:MAG: acetyl-CoA carboxylase biotin carboxylase subunit [Firmicutes bacterium]|jgi:acetyl-CoA carboxylase biotin carboxylase subunit|nr:acetyl-CoA carboxylase biotin carboxylase subunit [Bacillota bacterium]